MKYSSRELRLGQAEAAALGIVSALKVDLLELFSLCQQLLREQQDLRKSVRKTRRMAGLAESSDGSGRTTPRY